MSNTHDCFHFTSWYAVAVYSTLSLLMSKIELKANPALPNLSPFFFLQFYCRWFGQYRKVTGIRKGRIGFLVAVFLRMQLPFSAFESSDLSEQKAWSLGMCLNVLSLRLMCSAYLVLQFSVLFDYHIYGFIGILFPWGITKTILKGTLCLAPLLIIMLHHPTELHLQNTSSKWND